MLEFLRIPVGAVLRTLGSLDGLARFFQGFFYFTYSRRAISHSFPLAVQIALAALLNYIAALHDKMFPPHWRDQAYYILGLPLVAAVFTFVLVTVPLLLIRYHDQKRRAVSSQLNLILDQAALYPEPTPGATPFGTPPIKPEAPSDQPNDSGNVLGLGRIRELDADLLRDVVSAVRLRGSELFVLTPTGFYLCADTLLPAIREQFREGPALARATLIGENARELRNALEQFPGTLHFVMADLNDLAVSATYFARATRADLSEQLARRIVREARKAIKSIQRARRAARPPRDTIMHLTPYLPDRRLLVTEDACFVQMLPRAALGILEPVAVVEKGASPVAYATIRRSLKALASMV